MKKLLVQLGFVFSCAMLFSGCSNEASLPAEDDDNAFFEPLPRGLPVFTEIDEAFVADDKDGNSRSALYSYQRPENAQDTSETKQVFAADSHIIVSLNTIADNLGRSEVTLLVRNDSVYSIDHMNNQIRLLSHFSNTVCELLPRETVETATDQNDDKTLTVLHDELVYVMTAEGDPSRACISEGKKRFYALPLDHQLDPSQDEDAQSDSLELVNESLARATLIFGWVADTENQESGKQKLTYGYLGYGIEEITSPTLKPALVFYDDQRQQVWRQDRSLEKFPVLEVAPEIYSKAYLFHVQALENQHYLVQLGLDVFVVDSGEAIFSKTFEQTADILSDRSIRLSPDFSDEATPQAYALPVEAHFNADDLLIEDQGKLFAFAYQANTPARDPAETYQIIPQNPTNIAARDFVAKRFFSQFDLQACGNDQACRAAHNASAQSWQFLTPCTVELGCTLNNQVADNCETFEEKLITQSDEPLCTVSDYRHISELNESANDMTFKGFMQYKNYIRDIALVLENSRLYITANMHEKDILLRYNYNLDFSAPKSIRERVMFGSQTRLFGINAHFAQNNLFMTALTEGSVRSNECYKDYRPVACDLGNIVDAGGNDSCTGLDLSEGRCKNSYQEYTSHALFCSAEQLNDGTCSDLNTGQISTFSVETEDQDAKWLRLYDYSAAETNSYQMQLLVGDHIQARDASKLDEGRLLNPELFSVDMSSGQPTILQGAVDGVVEQAVSGWFIKEPASGNAEVLAHVKLISDELLSETNVIRSELVHYLVEQSFADALATSPDTLKVKRLGVSLFERP